MGNEPPVGRKDPYELVDGEVPKYVLGCLCGECVAARGSLALQEADREKLMAPPMPVYYLGPDNIYEYGGGAPPGTPLRVKWVEASEAWSEMQQRTLEKRAQERAERVAALHPHTNCPRCKEEKEEQDPKPGDPELEALIDCMRTSAQDTLANLRRAGWKITKA